MFVVGAQAFTTCWNRNCPGAGQKTEHIKDTGAEVLATGNAGCHMQIAAGARLAGMKLRVCHPVELLDESYQRAGLYEEGAECPMKKSVNFVTLAIFAPVLILAGVAGFLVARLPVSSVGSVLDAKVRLSLHPDWADPTLLFH